MRLALRGWLFAIMTLAAVSSATSAEPNDKGAKDGKKSLTLATFAIRGGMREGATAPGVFGEMQPTLRSLIDRIDAAGKDPKVGAILLEMRGATLGMAKVNELREAVHRARGAGKKVYAELDSGTNKDYLLACACDSISMPPSGALMITGLRAEVMFFKGLFEKLGVQADIIQVGDFKGAAEPYTRSEMSPQFRKQLEEVIDDYYKQMVQTITEDRQLDMARVRQLIDDGIFTPTAAQECHLIDRVCYQDEIISKLKTDLQVDELTIDKAYGKKKIDTDFSGFTGMVKMMEILMGVEPSKAPSTNPKVAVIYAVGVIMPGESKASLTGGETVGADTIIKAFRQAQDDDSVKAIVLRVDSPGGSAFASDLMWREITRTPQKKPIVASMGDVAASGGYYISMGTKKIFVEPGTLTGSIGVVGGKVAIKGLLDKFGVTTDVIGRGKNSGVLSINDPFTPSERDAWKKLMADIYKQFTTKAAEGRKMDLAKLEGLAQGKVYTGRQAVENGLADKIGTLADAINEAKQMGGLAAGDKVDILTLPAPKSLIEQIFNNEDDETEARAFLPQWLDAVRQADMLRELFTEPSVTVLPYSVKIE